MADASDHDFDALKQDVIVQMEDKLANARIEYESIVRVDRTDAPSLTVADLSGMGTFNTTSATLTPETLRASSNTVASVSRALTVPVFLKDIRDNPEIAAQIGAKMALAALSTMAGLVYTGIAGLFTLAHPDLTYAGAGKKFIDSFSETVTQSNKLTSALSRDALSPARQRIRGYKNKAGIVLWPDTANMNLALVVPTGLMDDAVDIVSTAGPTYDGAGLVSGSFQGIQVLDVPNLSDSDDWFVIHKPTTPLWLWVRKSPDMRVALSTTGPQVNFISEFEGVFGVDPFEAGIVGSSV